MLLQLVSQPGFSAKNAFSFCSSLFRAQRRLTCRYRDVQYNTLLKNDRGVHSSCRYHTFSYQNRDIPALCPLSGQFPRHHARTRPYRFLVEIHGCRGLKTIVPLTGNDKKEGFVRVSGHGNHLLPGVCRNPGHFFQPAGFSAFVFVLSTCTCVVNPKHYNLKTS